MPYLLARYSLDRPRGVTRTPVLWLAVLAGLLAAASAGAQPAADPCALGKDLYRAGKSAEARQAFIDCLEVSGESIEVLLPLTVMAIREGRLEEGVRYGSQAVAIAPQDAEARYWYGRALLRSGEVEAARAQWNAGLQVDMTHNGILEGLARLAIQEGEPAKAYNLLLQIRNQGVNEPWLHRLMIDLAAAKGMWSQALDHLQDAMKLEGPSAEDLLSAAELSLLGGQGEAAVRFSRQALSLEAGPASYGGLGEAFFATDQIDSALVYLRLAVIDPKASPRFTFNLANALEVAGLPAEAEGHFQAFLARVPDDPVGHFNYGIHLDRLGRSQEGMRQVARAVELDDGMLSARVVLAQMKENAGDFDGALALVAELKQRDKDNQTELGTWQKRLTDRREQVRGAQAEGKVHLQHMVVGSADGLARVQKELAAGEDFSSLVVRFSVGPGAAKGGDIGWINPRDMVPSMREAILALGLNEISPPVEAGGLYHLFKRIP